MVPGPDDRLICLEKTLEGSASKVELPPVRGAGYEPSVSSGEPTGVAHCLEVCTSVITLGKSFDDYAAKQSPPTLLLSTSISPSIILLLMLRLSDPLRN
jgi:hypothetical protein